MMGAVNRVWTYLFHHRLQTGRLLHQVRQPANVYFACLSPNQQMLMVGDWLGFVSGIHTGEPPASYVKLGEGMRGPVFWIKAVL